MPLRRRTTWHSWFWLLLLAAVTACTSPVPESSARFLSRWQGEDFHPFAPWAFFVRSTSRSGEKVVLVYATGQAKATCPAVYVLHIDSRQGRVSRRGLLHAQQGDTSCLAPTRRLEALALQFLRYNINYLAVNEQQQVEVVTKSDQVAELLKPGTPDHALSLEQYTPVAGSAWYVRTQQ